jgi:hypothetical protein
MPCWLQPCLALLLLLLLQQHLMLLCRQIVRICSVALWGRSREIMGCACCSTLLGCVLKAQGPVLLVLVLWHALLGGSSSGCCCSCWHCWAAHSVDLLQPREAIRGAGPLP